METIATIYLALLFPFACFWLAVVVMAMWSIIVEDTRDKWREAFNWW